MGVEIKTNKKYRQGYTVTETYIDGDLAKVTEEYKDDNGEVVYIYEYELTPQQMMKNRRKEQSKKKHR